MARRRNTRRRPVRRGRRQSYRPNLFWGRALCTTFVLLCIWAHWRGTA